ncbi:MAG TPA: hypothetical protein VMH30_06930 [Verrucomicrobiae bacterium]|nr:hypothetical protein [Verrucomicrobiae bacterium]
MIPSRISNPPSSPPFALFGFANELTIDADGWAMIAPLGDFPSEALLPTSNGRLQRQSAIQRITRDSAEIMVAQFHNSRAGVKKFIRGCNIYVGHPDMPGLESRYPDKEPKGVFADMEVREKGIYGLPVFTNEGMDLVEGRKLVNGRRVRGFSGRLMDATADGHKDGVPVFVPTRIVSAGLTPFPHLPVEFFNEEGLLSTNPENEQEFTNGEVSREARETAREGAGAHHRTKHQGEISRGMRETTRPAPAGRVLHNNKMKKKLLEICTVLGIQFANDADDAQTEAALDEAAAKVTAFAQTAKTVKQKLLGAARKAGIEFANEEAITDPVATLAQIEDRLQKGLDSAAATAAELAAARNQFANERTARIGDELTHAVLGGRITNADRTVWEGRLKVEAQFANEMTAIRALKPVVKTTSITLTRGQRKDQIDLANPHQRRQFVNEVLAEIALEQKLDPVRNSRQILNLARRRHPALFEVPHVEIKK